MTCDDQSWYAHPCLHNISKKCHDIDPFKVGACQTWKVAKCYNLDPQIQLWAEVGRRVYPAAAWIMAERSKGSAALTLCEKEALRPFYGGTVDHVDIHYHVSPMDNWTEQNIGIELPTESEAQTYGHEIYIRYDRDAYTDWDRLFTLAHELVHSEQFEQHSSSLEDFGYAYFKAYKIAGSYESNPLETDAVAKSEKDIGQVMVLYESCINVNGGDQEEEPRAYWQAGSHFRSGVLVGEGVDKQLNMDMAYDGPVLDEYDRLFAADGDRLYWQAGRHFRSGLLVGEGVDKQLNMDMAYDGPVLDENDRLFAAEGNRLFWQAGEHFRSGRLEGEGVDRTLQMDLAYDGPVLDANDRLFAASGTRLYWQAGRHFRSGRLDGEGVDRILNMDVAYDGTVLDDYDHLFCVISPW